MKYLIILAVFMASQSGFSQTKSYNWDAVHSNVNFALNYLVISEATGRFTASTGSLTYSKKDFQDAKIQVEVKVNSINTDDEKRDEHLKSPDFFDVKTYPTISFVSTDFEKVNEKDYNVTGKLTMKGVTKNVVANAKYLGETMDAYGQTFSLWKVNFAVNRQDFGVSFNKTNSAGDFVLGDEVRMSINAKFILKK